MLLFADKHKQVLTDKVEHYIEQHISTAVGEIQNEPSVVGDEVIQLAAHIVKIVLIVSGRDVGRELTFEAVAQLADIEREALLFIGEMLVECSPAYHRAFAQKIDRHIVEPPLVKQLGQRVMQRKIGLLYSEIQLFSIFHQFPYKSLGYVRNSETDTRQVSLISPLPTD